MLDTVRLAAVAVDSKPGDIEGNLAKIERWALRAAGESAMLTLFPELSLTGFIPNHPTGDHNAWLRAALQGAREMAISIPGRAIDRLVEIAAKSKTLLSVGLLEDAGNLLFDTQVVVGPEGLLGKWRKMHIPMFETSFYNAGHAAEVIETPLGRVGVNICFDALLPESTRLLGVNNAEIVLFPFAADPPPATPQEWQAWCEAALRCRCAENGVFGLAVNYVGDVSLAGVEQHFPGGGFAVDPRGKILEAAATERGQPGMFITEFQRDDLQAARAEPEYLFRFRRPELYGPLAE